MEMKNVGTENKNFRHRPLVYDKAPRERECGKESARKRVQEKGYRKKGREKVTDYKK